MDFLQLVLSRQSDRAYDKERPVEAEKLERILEAARLAPSACNAQPWKFVVVTDHELASKVGKAAAGLGMNKFAKDAPVHILVVEESANITSLLGGKVKGKHFPLIDIGIASGIQIGKLQLLHGFWSLACRRWAKTHTPISVGVDLQNHIRSEERRVGKECRSRWSPYH